MAVELTAPERSALEFAAAHDWVMSGQLRRLLGLVDEEIEATLAQVAGLEQAGLLASAPRLRHQRRAYRITRAGLARLGSDLPEPPAVPDLRRYWPDFCCAWMWVGARLGRFGTVDAVFSRRQMRVADKLQVAADMPVDGVSAELARKLRQPGFALDVGSGEGRYPALGLVMPQGRGCVELVMAGSGQRWLGRMLAGYVQRPQVVALLLWVQDRSQLNAVAAQVERHGLTDRTRIQPAVFHIDSP